MYFARFSSSKGEFLTAVYQWPMPEGSLIPLQWSKLLLKKAGIDLAIRIDLGGSTRSHVLLFLTAAADFESQLRNFCETLLRLFEPSGLFIPSCANEYDRLTGQFPSWQMRVDYDRYHFQGKPLACDFRLYSMIASCRDAAPLIYQFHLRTYSPDQETERSVRKHLAWLDIKKPFSEPVRDMQRMLARRLLCHGSIASEYLAIRDQISLEKCSAIIQTHFRETTGRIGFSEAPVEIGDFSELLISGRHPARDMAYAPSLPCEAATLYSEHEGTLLLASSFSSANSDNAKPFTGAKHMQPDVFISYASSDFAYASSACSKLEDNGLICWIAPRDINRDLLPYPEAIAQALSQARVVVVLLSDTANISVHIPKEIDLALERKLSIVPVRLQDIVPSGQLNYH